MCPGKQGKFSLTPFIFLLIGVFAFAGCSIDRNNDDLLRKVAYRDFSLFKNGEFDELASRFLLTESCQDECVIYAKKRLANFFNILDGKLGDIENDSVREENLTIYTLSVYADEDALWESKGSTRKIDYIQRDVTFKNIGNLIVEIIYVYANDNWYIYMFSIGDVNESSDKIQYLNMIGGEIHNEIDGTVKVR